jgi:hypothetical protein
MTTEFIRVLNGPSEDHNVIGFSDGVAGFPEDPRFFLFMHLKGFEYEPVDTASWHGSTVSDRYIEVRPPLSDRAVYEIGVLCVGGDWNDGRTLYQGGYYEGLFDPEDGAACCYFDNRHELPIDRHDEDTGFISWTD